MSKIVKKSLHELLCPNLLSKLCLLVSLFSSSYCSAATAYYTVNVNGVNYERGDRVEVVEGDDIYVELRVHLPSDPVPTRTYSYVNVTNWVVPPCFVFQRQFSSLYNNSNLYSLNTSAGNCYGFEMKIYHQSFPGDISQERLPVNVYIIISRRCTCDPIRPPLITSRIANGISGMSTDLQVSIFPNPSHDLLQIEFVDIDYDREMRFDILLFNERGSLVKKYEYNFESTTDTLKTLEFNVSDLQKGTYYLHVINDSKTVRKQVLIE